MFEKFEKFQIFWLAVILSLGLIFAVNTATKNLSNDKITVTGSANKTVIADSARMSFDLVARKANKQQSYNVIKTQLPIIKKYLEENGLTDIDVKALNGYNIYKNAPNGNSTNEIDFITQRFDKALPIEVKAEENLRSRSLKAVLDKDSSLRGLRISMSDYREEEKFDNLPLYAVKSYFESKNRYE